MEDLTCIHPRLVRVRVTFCPKMPDMMAMAMRWRVVMVLLLLLSFVHVSVNTQSLLFEANFSQPIGVVDERSLLDATGTTRARPPTRNWVLESQNPTRQW